MELKFYRLTFINNKEFLVSSNIKQSEEVLDKLSEGLVNGGYISLKLKDGDPIYLKKNKLFSVQSVQEGAVGAHNKIWSLLK